MPQAPYRPSIDRHGQPYYDEPIKVRPKQMQAAVLKAFGKQLSTVTVGFNRVPLIWKIKG
jgi:hypothetical protein